MNQLKIVNEFIFKINKNKIYSIRYYLFFDYNNKIY